MFGFHFDMSYILYVFLPSIAISGIASLMVRSAFNRYSEVGSRRGYTGAQAAQVLLREAGIDDVQVVSTYGYLSDHYNPVTKTLALSEQVYGSTSVAAIGVACHEAGHAIQHAHGYVPLWARSALVPVVGIGSYAANILIPLGFMLNSLSLMWLGVFAFGAIVLFQFITLPVEFDASRRAKLLCVEAGIIGADEREGVDAVLNAAALTYVAAFVGSLLTLLYYLIRLGVIGGGRSEE